MDLRSKRLSTMSLKLIAIEVERRRKKMMKEKVVVVAELSRANRKEMLAFLLSKGGLLIKLGRLNLISEFNTKFEWLILGH